MDTERGVTGFSFHLQKSAFFSFHLLGAVAAASNRVSQHFSVSNGGFLLFLSFFPCMFCLLLFFSFSLLKKFRRSRFLLQSFVSLLFLSALFIEDGGSFVSSVSHRGTFLFSVTRDDIEGIDYLHCTALAGAAVSARCSLEGPWGDILNGACFSNSSSFIFSCRRIHGEWETASLALLCSLIVRP